MNTLARLVEARLDWDEWERLIRRSGCTIDRPRGSRHPVFPEIIYPIDYGYINGTLAGDGQEIDVFVGTGQAGLVGVLLTEDFRRGDREYKFLWNCRPEEIYLVNGFINFDRSLMEGRLILRRRMAELWAEG